MIASVLSTVLRSSYRTGNVSRIIATATMTNDNVDDLNSFITDESGRTDGVETMSVSEEEGMEVTYWTYNNSAEVCTSHVAI